jgi:hypothetical protein
MYAQSCRLLSCTEDLNEMSFQEIQSSETHQMSILEPILWKINFFIGAVQSCGRCWHVRFIFPNAPPKTGYDDLLLTMKI